MRKLLLLLLFFQNVNCSWLNPSLRGEARINKTKTYVYLGALLGSIAGGFLPVGFGLGYNLPRGEVAAIAVPGIFIGMALGLIPFCRYAYNNYKKDKNDIFFAISNDEFEDLERIISNNPSILNGQGIHIKDINPLYYAIFVKKFDCISIMANHNIEPATLEIAYNLVNCLDNSTSEQIVDNKQRFKALDKIRYKFLKPILQDELKMLPKVLTNLILEYGPSGFAGDLSEGAVLDMPEESKEVST